MEINFEATIKTPENSVDMKAGLETFQGVSDSMRKISESLLNNEIVKRINYKSDLTTSLKGSFIGSYGQRFSMLVTSKHHQNKINNLGIGNFVDLLQFFVMESRYGESRKLSSAAENFLQEMSVSENLLTEEIRQSCMRKVHKIPAKFGLPVTLHYKSRSGNKILVGSFDKNSAELLIPKFDSRKIKINAGVTRLNINTGNGRIQLNGENFTTAFGFVGDYSFIDIGLKKKFSRNLNTNNGIDPKAWNYMELTVQRLLLKSGKIVKYIVHEAE